MVKRKNGYGQKSKAGIIELNQARRSDTYDNFALKAANALGLDES